MVPVPSDGSLTGRAAGTSGPRVNDLPVAILAPEFLRIPAEVCPVASAMEGEPASQKHVVRGCLESSRIKKLLRRANGAPWGAYA